MESLKLEIHSEIQILKEENEVLKKENSELKNRMNTLERQNKKYNIVVYGLCEEQNEQDDTQKFLDLAKHELEIDYSLTDFRSIRRIGKKTKNNNRPLSVECMTQTQKKIFLDKSEKLKDKKIYISNELSQADYQQRKNLYINLKRAKDLGLDAKIKGNALFINSISYTLEQLEKTDFWTKLEKQESHLTGIEFHEKLLQNNSTNSDQKDKTGVKRKNETNAGGNIEKRQTRLNSRT